MNAGLYLVLTPANLSWIIALPVLISLIAQRVILGKEIERDKKSDTALILAICLLHVTYCICPFIETFLLNSREFTVAFGQIILSLILGWIIISALSLAAGLTLVTTEAKLWMASGMLNLAICGYIQGAILNGSMFLLEGKDYVVPYGKQLINILIWTALTLGIFALLNLGKTAKYRVKVITYGSAFLIAIQLIGLVGLIPQVINKDESSKQETNVNYLSTVGLNEIAQDKNVIVFILDTYDEDFLEEALLTKPDLLDNFTGFTRFPDTVSQFSRTFPSLTYIMTHEPYYGEIPRNEYVNNAFEKCSFWEKLDDRDYSYYLYLIAKSDASLEAEKKALNFVEAANIVDEKFSSLGCLEATLYVGEFRLLPLSLKNLTGYTSESLEELIIKERLWEKPLYEENDSKVIKTFKEEGLNVNSDKNALRIIHLMGAHAPYVMDADGNKVKDRKVSPVEQYIGSLNYVSAYLSELKRLGKYDDSLIIVAADHGENYVSEKLPEETNPILFIKPFNVDSSVQIKESDERASLEDILPTISTEIGMNESYDKGFDLANLKKNDLANRTREHWFTVVKDGNRTGVLRYEITGDSRDFSNWTETDEYVEYIYVE